MCEFAVESKRRKRSLFRGRNDQQLHMVLIEIVVLFTSESGQRVDEQARAIDCPIEISIRLERNKSIIG